MSSQKTYRYPLRIKAPKAYNLPRTEYAMSDESEFLAVTASIYLRGKSSRKPHDRPTIRSAQPDYYKFLSELFDPEPAGPQAAPRSCAASTQVASPISAGANKSAGCTRAGQWSRSRKARSGSAVTRSIGKCSRRSRPSRGSPRKVGLLIARVRLGIGLGLRLRLGLASRTNPPACLCRTVLTAAFWNRAA
jgi:hypothetical protein